MAQSKKKAVASLNAKVIPLKHPKAANPKLLQKLDAILETEISGVTRYLHYSLMITGPNRIPIVKFFRDQAAEALTHATTIGEKITALGGHPSLKVQPVPETNQHSTMEILQESLEFELQALKLYKDVLKLCKNDIALEELIREFIRNEQEHVEEVYKMLKVSGDRRA